MSSDFRDRGELLKALGKAVRGISGQGVLFSHAVAERVGLNPTDLECLGFLAEEGGMPAGKLAEVTGLTTGAITRMIDRLAAAGYVERETDPDDRRKVIVRPRLEKAKAIEPFFASLEASMAESFARYSKPELQLLLEFLERGLGRLQEQIALLRTGPEDEAAARDGGLSAPAAGVERASLEFASGAAELTLKAEALEGELYRARFKGPAPQVRVRGGEVTIEYRRFSLSDWARLALGGGARFGAELSLSSAVPWRIDLRRGVSRVTARLSSLVLEAFEIRGGASGVDVTLPSPRGAVPVRLSGGASEVTLRCPAGSAFKLELSGGASSLKVGSQSFGAVGGRMHWESPRYDPAGDRYEFSVTGGASHLTIEG